jgi:hypothetical protein
VNIKYTLTPGISNLFSLLQKHFLLQVMSEYDQAQAIEEVTGFAPR